jgi:hypothetical protein
LDVTDVSCAGQLRDITSIPEKEQPRNLTALEPPSSDLSKADDLVHSQEEREIPTGKPSLPVDEISQCVLER